MPSGAFALYIDEGAGGGPNGPINRVVPLPALGQGDEIHFATRRLTLAYDNLQPGTSPTITVTVRFLGTGAPETQIDLDAGRCRVLEVPPEACAASFFAEPTAGGTPRGALSALVEYSS
jgi:hypothetical protein